MAARFRPSCYHVATALGIKSKGAILLWDINPGAGSTILQVEDGDNEACHPFSRFLGNSRDVMCSTAGGHIQIWSGTMSRLKLHVQLEGFDRDNAAIKAWECAESGGRVMLHMDDDSVAVWDISDAIASANTENLFGSMDTSSTTLQFYSPIATWEMEGCRAQMSPCGGFMVKHGYGPVMVCTTTGDVLGELGLSGGHRPHCHTYNFSNDGSLVIGSSSQSPRLYVWLTSRPPRQVTCLEPMDADNYSLQKDPGCFVDFSIFPVPLASTVGPARGTMALGTGGGWWVAAVASVTSTPGSDEPPSSGVYWWALVNPTPSKIISTSYAYHPDHRPNTCVFSPNGRMLASYGLDGRVIVWELQGRGKNGKVIGNRKLYKGGVEFVSWSSDSQMLAICGLPGASDTTTAPDVAYVACVATGRISACLQARPSCSFAMVSFSPDCRYVAAAHTDGSVGIYTRAGAQDMAPTDFCFYLRNGKRAAGFHTDELVKTLIRHPLMANHVSQEGHNLITSLVLMRDPASLEQLLNLAPRNVPLLSYKTGYWRDGKYKPIDAMSLALQRSDQGILYDLLMAMADGKVTPQSWESLLDSGRDSLDGSGFWMQLCKEFPSLVLVFLTRLNPELLDDDVDFADRQGNLATGEMYVAGSSVYLPECLQSFWRKKTALQMKSWRRQIMEYCKERYRWMTNAGDDEQQVTQKCVSRRVNIPWILRPGERGFLKELVESDCPSAVYGTPVVRAVLQYKWRQFGRRMFAWECFFYVLQLISFTSFALIYSDLEPVPCSKGLHQKPSTVVTDVMNHYKSEQETSVNGYKEEVIPPNSSHHLGRPPPSLRLSSSLPLPSCLLMVSPPLLCLAPTLFLIVCRLSARDFPADPS